MSKHQITRLRHETRRRTLTVTSAARLTPNMLRLEFTCADLDGFVSASFDDHVKLFFPTPETRDGERPPMRDFTPRRFDVGKGTMTIDFAVHDAGPATAWAMAAGVGDTLEIGGPRGSTVVPDDFDWYLLIGDETALPAIGRRLEELRAGVPVTTVVLVDNAADAQAIATHAAWTPHWIIRQVGTADVDTLLVALTPIALPEGEGFVWIAGESALARGARAQVVDALSHPKEWTKAAGYWRKGQADAHERIEE